MSITTDNSHEEDHGHHHKETWITKYIFSQDHKMIAKQYLIKVVKVGKIIKKRKLRILDLQGKELFFSVLGFKHF